MTRGIFTPTELSAAELNDCFDVPRCRLTNSAAISLTTGINTTLTFDTEVFDDGGMHSTSTNTARITVPTGGSGLYIIGGNVEFASNSTGVRSAFIVLNGSTSLAIVSSPAASASVTRLSVSTIYALNDGDYVELKAQQSSGGALNLNSSSDNSPIFWACWLAVL
jgi:hypothetical protein